MHFFFLHFKECGETLCQTSLLYLRKDSFPFVCGHSQPSLLIQAILDVRGRSFPMLKSMKAQHSYLSESSARSHPLSNP